MTPGYCAVVVTFRRPESLRVTLRSVMAQRHRPNFVVVADNDSGRSAERIIAEETWPVPVINLPMPRNVGPAGGWGAATRYAGQRDDRGEWLLVLDDDDPIRHPDVVGSLLDQVPAADVAAVGLKGATVIRPFGLLRRVHGPMGPADYLSGGGLPLYRWAALDAAGGFDESLFFGFEDLDIGLRLRARGWSLLAVDDAEQPVAGTNPRRTPWREYYKARALVTIVRRHLGPTVTTLTLIRLGFGGARLLITDGGKVATARLLGIADGVRGRLGVRRYDPQGNPPKGEPPS
ncbi:MAG TPA: glycosyltransferase [Acidimicrobiia bacterium]|nr:glycosyltransferase [Acidimicrobiia bacterium]